ncbi:MAG: MoaD/ThiS family protein [Rhodocyclaceae bacterium]|nr:MoaD/ThiS family protein [Rhodocyclaceae bacterium]
MARVVFGPGLRHLVGQTASTEVTANTLWDLLDTLQQRYPELQDLPGPDSQWPIAFFLNGRLLEDQDHQSIKLSGADQVLFFQPISGG